MLVQLGFLILLLATGSVIDLANGTSLLCSTLVNGTNCTSGLNYDYQVHHVFRSIH